MEVYHKEGQAHLCRHIKQVTCTPTNKYLPENRWKPHFECFLSTDYPVSVVRGTEICSGVDSEGYVVSKSVTLKVEHTDNFAPDFGITSCTKLNGLSGTAKGCKGEIWADDRWFLCPGTGYSYARTKPDDQNNLYYTICLLFGVTYLLLLL